MLGFFVSQQKQWSEDNNPTGVIEAGNILNGHVAHKLQGSAALSGLPYAQAWAVGSFGANRAAIHQQRHGQYVIIRSK